MNTTSVNLKFMIAVLTILTVLAVNGFCSTTITLADVKSRALEYNRTYLSAQEEIVKAGSEITKAKSGAFPSIDFTGSYTRNMIIPSFFVTADDEIIEFKTGFKNNFSSAIMLRQSLYKGGKVFTALSIAKQYKKYISAVANQVEAKVLLNAELLFHAAVLKQSNLDVINKSYEAAEHNLSVAKKMFNQGLVSEFELLRAKVETGNLKPEILQAESDLRLSHKDLKSFIGLDLNEDILLVEIIDDTALTDLQTLEEFISTALESRPEMIQSNLLESISKKAIRIAKSGYYPTLEAVSMYSWQSQSDALTLSENTSRSFTAGLNLTIPIFNGGETRGDVTMRRAEYNQAKFATIETRDFIKLEVERIYDQIIQTKKSLEIQSETIAQAEEGLRIANLRYETGIGTQLEVLSAQAALTKARNSLAQAKFFFRKAKAELKKSTTVKIN